MPTQKEYREFNYGEEKPKKATTSIKNWRLVLCINGKEYTIITGYYGRCVNYRNEIPNKNINAFYKIVPLHS